MAYIDLDRTKPVTTDSRQLVLDWTRYDINALTDAIIIGCGMMPGYGYSWASGTAVNPENMYYKNGNDWIRLGITWGTTGGATGNASTILFEISDDGGSNWTTLGTWSCTYDANGNPTTTSWA